MPRFLVTAAAPFVVHSTGELAVPRAIVDADPDADSGHVERNELLPIDASRDALDGAATVMGVEEPDKLRSKNAVLDAIASIE